MKKLICFIFFSLFSINLLHAFDLPFLEGATMHGDVRTKWKSTWGEKESHGLRAEANLGCDYLKDNVWVSVKGKGATSGQTSELCLDKAMIGYQVLNKSFDTAVMTIGLEGGRNKLDSMFDSKMQYDSYFNGLHLIYTFTEPGLIDFTLHGGPHVIDSSRNHYGWLAEGIWHNIASTPLTVKYSFTDWVKRKGERELDEWNDKFAISQVTASYGFEHVTVYGAYLHNHQVSKHNDGFYLGATAGKIRKAHDFLVDVNFQLAKTHLLLPADNKGLKRGVQAKLVYALAENLNLEAKFARLDKDSNNKLEFQAIYAF